MTSVGYKLYREIRDLAPPDWTPAERAVAWVIADDARDDTRASWIAAELLQARTGLSETGVRGALQRLAGRGYEFRVPHGYGKDGRPVYATRGHAVDYAVPDITAIGDTSLSPMAVDNPTESRHEAVAIERGKATAIGRKATAEPPKGDSLVSPHTSIPSITTSTEELQVSDSNVEDAPLSTGGRESNGAGPRPSRLELAAWQATRSRRSRGARP